MGSTECLTSKFTVAGLSGGFIFEVVPGKAIEQYRWIGVQASQKFIEKAAGKRATSIKCTDARTVCRVIDDYI